MASVKAHSTLVVVLLLTIFSGSASAQMITLWPGKQAPRGWLFCDGAELETDEHPALSKAIGTTYGGDGEKFRLPDLSKAAEKSLVNNARVRHIIADGYPGSTFLDPPVGQITFFASNFEPHSFAYAEGQRLDKEKNAMLFSVIGSRYASYGEDLFLPDLRVRVEMKGKHPDDVRMNRWYNVRRWPSPLVALRGPSPDTDHIKPDPTKQRSLEPFVGQVVLYAGSVAPRGWAKCEGQLLAINQNDALFALVGTIYGGDGRETFGLPDLREKTAILRKAAGLPEKSEHLSHIIALYGIFPSRT